MRRGRRPLLLTCEHASAAWPSWCRVLGDGVGTARRTHRGWDLGALTLARALQRRTGALLLSGRYSRLLVELNRSPRHPRLWSEFSKGLPDELKERLLREYYGPYRRAVADRVRAWLRRQGSRRSPVLHVSVHTFTPVLKGEVRRADVGLLYDPGRELERRLCALWKARLEAMWPGLRVRRNYPYLGVADGMATWLRGRFSEREYAGIELEVSQRFPERAGAEWRKLRRVLADSLWEVIEETRS